ncbi:MAG: DUF2207 domain-containing protein [Actinomycetes bacterium]
MSVGRRRPLALLGSVLTAVAAVIVLAAPAQAEDINAFNVAVSVNADTSMSFTETINYDFGSESRHGIFRDIPVYDVLDSGENRYYGVSVESVTQDGQVATYELSDNDRYLEIKIGDADTLITGAHVYVIKYTVRNGLRVITAQDMADGQLPASVAQGDVEMYWDLIGDAWQVPIADARGAITGPADALTASCFWGYSGSTATCPASVSGSAVSVGGIALQPNEGVTASVVYPRSAFTTAPVEDVRTPDVPLGIWTFLGSIPVAGLFLIVPGIFAAFMRRKDKGVDLNAAPPMYEPPDGLSPAEMVAAWKGEKDAGESRVLAATLVDLAARGWVVLQTGDELVVRPTAGGQGELRPWERDFIDQLMPGGEPAVLQKYDKEHTEVWTSTYGELVTAAKASGRRNPNGDKPDKRWNWLLIVTVVCFVLGFITIFFAGAVAAFLIPVAIGSLIGFFIARLITPRQETQQSAEFIAKVNGLERVLSTDPSVARRDVAIKLGLPPAAVMATMLPFAVVFKLEKSWMGAFPDLTPADFAATGFGFLTLVQINGLVNSTSSSAHAATMTQSSGSGGGGFSGGGGGGGGGGSW